MTPYQKRTLSPLAQRMAGDMCVRNLSQRTIDAYTYHVERFARSSTSPSINSARKRSGLTNCT